MADLGGFLEFPFPPKALGMGEKAKQLPWVLGGDLWKKRWFRIRRKPKDSSAPGTRWFIFQPRGIGPKVHSSHIPGDLKASTPPAKATPDHLFVGRQSGWETLGHPGTLCFPSVGTRCSTNTVSTPRTLRFLSLAS